MLFGNFNDGVQVIENYAKEAAGFLFFWGTIVVVFIKPPLSGDPVANIVTYSTIFALIFLPVIIISALLNYIKGGKLAEGKKKASTARDRVRGAAQGAKETASGAAESGAKAAEKVHRDIEKPERAAKTAEKAEGILRKADGGIKWIPSNVKSAITNLVKVIPGGKALVKGGKNVAKKSVARKGARAAGTAARGAESVSILPGIILIIIIAPFLWALQASIIGGMFWGMVEFWLPYVAGPFMEAVGLGTAYANVIGGDVANSEVGVAASQGELLPPGVSRTFSQAGARVGCFLEGPQCMRQWRLNNTVRPGSESRGERYELQIQQFTLGTDRIDSAYKEADYQLPVNFLVSNTRNGLKGIPARNVSYKIMVKDFDKTYCDTGWRNISSFYSDEGRNVILPGLGVSPTDSLEELNLGNCGLLQPSMGEDRVLELQARYEYSSQATLYVDAMSRQYRREEGIEPSFEKSKTADTPVQSYINVKQPVTYYETEAGERLAVPFAARFGFETPGFDVRYRIDPESVKIVDSSLTTHVQPCVGINKTSGENNYNVSGAAEKRIELRQDGNWFNSEDEPAPLRCTMKLTEDGVNRISPTGEELVMRIDGNYTVVKQDTLSGFDAVNTLCTRYNCPLLVTEQFNESSKYNLRSKCKRGTSIDSRDGCTVRLPEQGNPDSWRTPTIANRSGENIVIEQGKVARNITNYVGSLSASSNSGTSEYFKDEFKNSNKNLAFGTPQDGKFEDKANDASGAILYESARDEGNSGIEQIDRRVCERNNGGPNNSVHQSYMYAWGEETDRKPLYMTIEQVDCKTSPGLLEGFWKSFKNNFTWWGDKDPSISEIVGKCEDQGDQGLTVSNNGDLRCYGGTFEGGT
ncbi:hypothetical protein GLU64_00515 [Nanohaloarchaea archaeon]|nr:hypothetical protein [Candidatus Nanohaloarchaea archaeon]